MIILERILQKSIQLLQSISAETLAEMCKIVGIPAPNFSAKSEYIDAFTAAISKHKDMKAARETQELQRIHQLQDSQQTQTELLTPNVSPQAQYLFDWILNGGKLEKLYSSRLLQGDSQETLQQWQKTLEKAQQQKNFHYGFFFRPSYVDSIVEDNQGSVKKVNRFNNPLQNIIDELVESSGFRYDNDTDNYTNAQGWLSSKLREKQITGESRLDSTHFTPSEQTGSSLGTFTFNYTTGKDNNEKLVMNFPVTVYEISHPTRFLDRKRTARMIALVDENGNTLAAYSPYTNEIECFPVRLWIL